MAYAVPGRAGDLPLGPFRSASGPSALLLPGGGGRAQSQAAVLGDRGREHRQGLCGPPASCCPSAPGVCRDPGVAALSGGSLRNLEAADPAPQSVVLSFALSPWCVSVLSCCQVDTWFASPPVGGKQTGLSAGLVSAVHFPLQKEAPRHHPQAGGLSGCPASCRGVPEGLPSLCTDAGSSPLQVFLPRALAAHETGPAATA